MFKIHEVFRYSKSPTEQGPLHFAGAKGDIKGRRQVLFLPQLSGGQATALTINQPPKKPYRKKSLLLLLLNLETNPSQSLDQDKLFTGNVTDSYKWRWPPSVLNSLPWNRGKQLSHSFGMQVTKTSNSPPLASNKRQGTSVRLSFLSQRCVVGESDQSAFWLHVGAGLVGGRGRTLNTGLGALPAAGPRGDGEGCRRAPSPWLCLRPSTHSFLCRAAGNALGCLS